MGDKIKALQALDLFKDHLTQLDLRWSEDGNLSKNEIKDLFFTEAPVKVMQKVAEAFDCTALANAGKRFTKTEFVECSEAETPPVETRPLDVQEKPKQTEESIWKGLLGKESLESFLDNTSKEKPVVLLIWSRNCHHCIKQKPTFTKIAEENQNKAAYIAMEFPFRTGEHDVEEVKDNEFLVKRFELSGLPTIIALNYENGEWKVMEIKTEPDKDDEGHVLLENGRPTYSEENLIHNVFKRYLENVKTDAD